MIYVKVIINWWKVEKTGADIKCASRLGSSPASPCYILIGMLCLNKVVVFGESDDHDSDGDDHSGFSVLQNTVLHYYAIN